MYDMPPDPTNDPSVVGHCFPPQLATVNPVWNCDYHQRNLWTSWYL